MYMGSNAGKVEESLGLSGDEILYVGDHLFVDVSVTKNVLRWRTALVLRELEKEIQALQRFADRQADLSEQMREKEQLEAEHAQLRLQLQRKEKAYGLTPDGTETELRSQITDCRQRIAKLDQKIEPLARASGRLHNPNWGLVMRTGKDKSYLARQMERYADIYTSRVSNFLDRTPYAYLRSHRGSLPHDR